MVRINLAIVRDGVVWDSWELGSCIVELLALIILFVSDGLTDEEADQLAALQAQLG